MPTIRQAAAQLGIGYDVAANIARELGLGRPLGPGLPKILTVADIAAIRKAAKERPKPGRRWPKTNKEHK